MLESKFGKIKSIKKLTQNKIPDVLDNLESEGPPRIAKRQFENPSDAAPVLERLCPKESVDLLRTLTADFEPGTPYRARIPAGHAENGTKHVHDFVIEKSDTETSLYFVDPEHYVGERNLLRPSISNLMSAKLPKDSEALPSVAILRFRTQSLADADKSELKMEQQLRHARELLTNDAMPPFLQSAPQDTLFRAIITPEEGLVQSRYVDNQHGLDLFLSGVSSAPVLEGKITAQQAILHRFIALLENHAFQPIKEKRDSIE